MGNLFTLKHPDKNINLNQVPYNCLTNFENTTEKECIKADQQNDRIYKKLLESVRSAEKHVKDTGLYFNLEVPIPPHPSNRDKYLLWKKRNVNHHVIPQSEAIIFLQENGYKLNIDYEPYQAIELSKEIKKQEGIPLKNDEILQSKNFDNVYTSNDPNLFRRRSMYGRNQFLETRDKFSERPQIFNKNINQNSNDINNNFISSENNINSNIYLAPSAPLAPISNLNEEITKNNSIYPSI